MTDFQQKYASYTCALKTANDRNKTALFDALAATSITSVSVTFDGEGDSGQIEDLIAFTGTDQTQFPDISITIQNVTFGSQITVGDRPCSLQEAAEQVCYGYLEQEHGGWENNDGAHGTFEIDVSERKIDLEFNGRYIATETSSHTF